jgi:hypothetical protein
MNGSNQSLVFYLDKEGNVYEPAAVNATRNTIGTQIKNMITGIADQKKSETGLVEAAINKSIFDKTLGNF